jgi:hypothetical protein
VIRIEVRPRSTLEDVASGFGYNRDLTGAAQALGFDSAVTNSILAAESNVTIESARLGSCR